MSESTATTKTDGGTKGPRGHRGTLGRMSDEARQILDARKRPAGIRCPAGLQGEAGPAGGEGDLRAQWSVERRQVMMALAGGRPRIRQQSAEGEIRLYGVIGWDIMAEDFARQLDDFGGRDIDLQINSPGGDVFDARAMKSQMDRYDGLITAHVDGLCGSAATTVAMGADRMIISQGAKMMIHNAWTVAAGDSAELSKMAELLATINNEIAQDYADRVGSRDKAEWLAMMDEETWFSASDAVKIGLCDEVADTGRAEAVAENRHRLAAYARLLTIDPQS